MQDFGCGHAWSYDDLPVFGLDYSGSWRRGAKGLSVRDLTFFTHSLINFK